MTRWHKTDTPEAVRIGAGGWLLVALRLPVIGVICYGGLLLLLLLRLAEYPLYRRARPLTPHITTAVCRACLAVLGLRHTVSGHPMRGQGAVVANHSSWLDIFVLNACQTVYFVSKAEVARWPGIGWLARATGTVFIARDPKQAKVQRAEFEDRLRAGHRLLFFPEGTSTDGLGVLPFKSTLFAAFLSDNLKNGLRIQPVSVLYRAPRGRSRRFYGWWGDMAFAPHFLTVLAEGRQGGVEVVFHDPVAVADFPDRKALALYCEETVRAELRAGQGDDFWALEDR